MRRVTIRLNAIGLGEVLLDGQPIETTALSVTSEVGEATEVTLVLPASEVELETYVEPENLWMVSRQSLESSSPQRSTFRAERAVHHGGMAVYHLENILVYSDHQAWDEQQAPIEAAEAWHFASLLSDEDIKDILQPKVEEDPDFSSLGERIVSTVTQPLIVYIPDTRGVVQSRYGRGNLKIGPGVYTYSRLPGRPNRPALGSGGASPIERDMKNSEIGRISGLTYSGTCPGSTPECESICYAARPVTEAGPVLAMWLRNSITADVPPIPEDAKLLRLHVSGDFDSVEYIENWVKRLTDRPDVTCWVYTRSWRVLELLPALERLRALPNVQMLASMDLSTVGLPPEGWRRAWIDGDRRAGNVLKIDAHTKDAEDITAWTLQRTKDGVKSLICPEETKAVANCETCKFCFDGSRNDVTFLKH
jgi:hypothetical protein